MASIINADTSNGLKLTSDTSGEIKLQSAGTDIASVTANGIDVTGDFTVDTTTLHVDATNNRVGIGTSSPTESLSVFRSAASQTEGINIRNTTSGYGSRLTFETIRSDDSSVQDMAAIQVYATSGYTDAASSDAVMTFETQDNGTTAERVRIDGVGHFSVGASAGNPTSGGTKYYVGGTNYYWGNWVTSTVTKNQWTFNNPNGEVGRITTNGSSTSFLTSSDYRLKENNVNIADGISRVKLLKPYRFNFIADADKTVDGFFAHEVQDVVPEAIAGTKDEVDNDGNPVYQGIDQAKLVPLLTAALQEAITKIEDLETRIQALENA